jgi:SM-20-related protein
MHQTLETSPCWGLRCCIDNKLLGMPPEIYRTIGAAERQDIAQACYKQGSEGFAFLREEVWRETATAAGEVNCFNGIEAIFRSTEFLDLCGLIANVDRVELAEISYVRYRPGDFYAFTVGPPSNAELGFLFDLTPSWEVEWGGLLEIANYAGGVDRAYASRFNSLVLYSLYRLHGISTVAPFARSRRQAICGKLHTIQSEAAAGAA